MPVGGWVIDRQTDLKPVVVSIFAGDFIHTNVNSKCDGQQRRTMIEAVVANAKYASTCSREQVANFLQSTIQYPSLFHRVPLTFRNRFFKLAEGVATP